ncbi:uncharacterized protein B0H18DRAFT_1081007 [Fomitopsis serialis]|uniref:uncharacterized protein n=1 Tax=Fomitopsis serialis TaxID=139415 RepID=UPI0020088411|nr:uncharacterized protein B0H18DRAFT_1081007 [Neoantrodia serialis]KAH9938275.1 hypothetical protein B0H18DRAFT_1081007 [Neoantrodia serialis]
MAAAFSRFQLAAALIEYDNDDSDPSKPRRSAQESAIFAHLRRDAGPRRETASRRSTDYLGVALPSEVGSIRGPESVYGGRESVMDGHRPRTSIDALHNPFRRDSTYEGALDEDEDEEAAELEVDLSSWGLDGYIPEDKVKGKHKAKSDILPNPHDLPLRRRSGMHGSRSMSMGNFDDFGEGGAFLDEKSTPNSLNARRHSFGSPLDAPMAKQPTQRPPHRGRTVSSHALIENLPITPPLHAIPFPSTETVRSPSPASTDALNLVRPQSRGSESVLNRSRALSTTSFGSPALLNEEKPNPFAVRPPSPDRASRFDPKARARTTSYGSLGTMLTPELQPEDANPFAVRPPSPSRSSRFDPKARARTVSALLDMDAHSSDDNRSQAAGRTRPYSRLELMRPKVLIMPSPLQSAMASGPLNSALQARAIEGAELHASDAAPLPPGARTARRSSTTLSMLDSGRASSPGLVASNSFTPNPRASLTLSQLTFRNNLPVDAGPTTPAPEIVIDPADRSKRPAGKLYGRSLIDALRPQTEMKGKQRVFRGDERPSMMARPQVQRSSTLIDPDSLKPRPQSQLLAASSSQPNLSRRNTLLQLDDELPGAPRRTLSGNGFEAANKKSVFGVDALWGRELAKLRDIEEQEPSVSDLALDRSPEPETQTSPGLKTPETPYVLPEISRATVRKRRGPPPPTDDDDESDSDDAPAVTSARCPKMLGGDDDSSDEDVPLVATIGRAAQRASTRVASVDDDSDEEKPLSALLDKGKLKLPSFGSSGGKLFSDSSDKNDDDEEDDTPLGLRVSRVMNSSQTLGFASQDADDDKPLALHPEQLRKTQYMSMMVQQQQQQQMMMQAQAAQFHQSMIFSAPSMMASGFFGPP